MRQRMFLLILLFVLILTKTNDISAKETKLNEDMFTNVENTLKEKEIDVSYTQLVKQLIHGNVKGVLHTIKAKMKEVFLNRMLIQKDLIREILLIAFTAAIFKNLSDSFFQQSTANSAFYITYVILCGVMVHSFFYLNKTVTQLVTLMADYMKGMIMAYSLAVVSTSGITTSTTVYEFYDNPYKCCITSDDQDLICLKDHQPYIKRRTFFKTMQNARRYDQVSAQRIPKCPVRSPADPVDDPSSR